MNALIIFFSSFLIDFDHYIVYVKRKKEVSLRKSYIYFKNLKTTIQNHLKNRINIKTPLVIFHTFEFLILTFILALFFEVFLFLLVGMLFHSLLDIIDIQHNFKTLSPRPFSLISYLIKKKHITYL